MSLVRYSGTNIAKALQSQDLIVVESVKVAVRDLDGNIVSLYKNSVGTTPKTNPFTTDNTGQFFFYVEQGEYIVDTEKGGQTGSIQIDLTQPSGGGLAMTLDEAINSTDIAEGDTIRITDRADGLFDVLFVDAGGPNEITPNELNIVQSIAQPLLALNLRIDDRVAIGVEFGIVADMNVTYDGGWVISGGTDQSWKINKIVGELGFTTLMLPNDWIRCDGRIFVTSGTNLIGSDFAQGFGGIYTSLTFAGGPTDDFIVEDPNIFEVSHLSIKGCRVFDAREQLTGVAPTGGRGLFVNKAVNSQIIEECFFSSFPDGSLFLGSDSNARSADNIVVNKVWCFSDTAPGISIGNMNNTCRISNIFCDGPLPVIQRLNGNQNTCVYDFSSIKHETGPGASTQTTISMLENDNVFCHSIIRRSDNDVAVISPPSARGSYLNIRNTSLDGTVNKPPFEDENGVIIEGSVNNYIPNPGALSSLKNYEGDELLYMDDFGVISKKITGLTTIDHPPGAANNSTNTKLVEKLLPPSPVATLVLIDLSVTTGSSFAGKIDLLYAGDIRGAGIAAISGRIDAFGNIVNDNVTMIGGGGIAYDNVEIEIALTGAAGQIRLGFTNNHPTFSTYLKAVITITCQPGSGQMIG